MQDIIKIGDSFTYLLCIWYTQDGVGGVDVVLVQENIEYYEIKIKIGKQQNNNK